MDRKVLMASILVIIAIALAIFTYISMTTESPKKDDNFDYSLEAKNWIKQKNATVSYIDVSTATKGAAQNLYSQIRYIDTDGEIRVLTYDGSYEGNQFNRIYYDGENAEKMKIYPEMNPNDGIIDSFVLLKKEDGKFAIYLFVDEDWKKRAKDNLNIIWGQNIKDFSSMHTRPFDFSKGENGIYYDVLTEDIDWFMSQNPIIGRLLFGEISMDNLISHNYNSTFVVVV